MPSDPLTDANARSLTENMLELNELAERYGDVPEVGRQIKSTLSTHMKKPDVRAVLCEPDANQLWKDGQELEGQGHTCCALLVYEEAVAELPAPSAVLAQKRLEQWKSDPKNIEDAEVCRALKWCHQKYPIAERLAKAEPDRAPALPTNCPAITRRQHHSRRGQEAACQAARFGDKQKMPPRDRYDHRSNLASC